MNDQPCCTPDRGAQTGGAPLETTAAPTALGSGVPARDLAVIESGRFTMGSDEVPRWPTDGEGPARRVTLPSFRIARFAVTADEFEAFVSATGHLTVAERDGWSFVFGGLLPDSAPPTRGVAGAEWWRQVEGADWAHPTGPWSSTAGAGDHPVVHVSHDDSLAYCAWAGVRLPTEPEWECAARGGLSAQRYTWGDTFEPDGEPLCNIFRGTFPTDNTAADGFPGTAPVNAFPPNGFGLHNAAGNVWEWCADWFSPSAPGQRVIRGGSYLCHDSYCDRYRVAARSSNSADSSTGNMGFRVAADL